jgi:hypothetical protein
MSSKNCVITVDKTKGEARLKVDTEMMTSYDTQSFRAACLDLMASGQERLVIDMRRIGQIPSGILSSVVDLALILGASPEKLCRVKVLVSQGVAEQFRLLGIDAAALEIVPAHADASGRMCCIPPTDDAVNR